MFGPDGMKVPKIDISTCSRQGMVPYTLWLHAAVCRMLEDGRGEFEKWIHTQLIQYGGLSEYNQL